MSNFDNSFKKIEDEKYNYTNNILPFLTTNMPLSLTLENNILENDSVNDLRLDSKKFMDFLYENNEKDEKDYNNSNFFPLCEIPSQQWINLKEEEEEKIKNKNNKIENIPEKEIKYIELQNNNNNIKFVISKKNYPIFNIEKIIKLGRLKKDSNKKGKHDKYKQDNIIRRFKVLLTHNIYNYLNNSFTINKNKNKKTGKKVQVIKKISSKFTKSIIKEDNINWLNSTVKAYFSNVVSKRFFTYDDKYNQKTINKIYKKRKEKDAIEILDKTIKEFWQVYINDGVENKYNGFHTIKDDINKFMEKGETEEYINKYIKVVNQFENIFNNMKSRKKKK